MYFINIENVINHLSIQNIFNKFEEIKSLDLQNLCKSGTFCM